MSQEIRRFLLGTLDEAERLAFEERLLVEDELAEHVAAEERDLLDAHLRGELSANDAECLEAGLLTTPVGRDHAEVAKALHQLDESSRQTHMVSGATPSSHRRHAVRRSTVWWAGAAAAVLLVVVGGRWWLGRDAAARETLVVELSSLDLRSSTRPPAVVRLGEASRRLELVIDLESHAHHAPFHARLHGPGETLLLDLPDLEPTPEKGYPILRLDYLAQGPLSPGTYRLELDSPHLPQPLRQTFRLVR